MIDDDQHATRLQSREHLTVQRRHIDGELRQIEVVIDLRNEDRIERLASIPASIAIHQMRNVGIGRRNRCHRTRTLRCAGAINRVEPPAIASSDREQPRIIATSRTDVGHTPARLDACEGQHVGRMTQRVAIAVRLRTPLIGHGGDDVGRRGCHFDRLGGSAHHDAWDCTPGARPNEKRQSSASQHLLHCVLPNVRRQ